MGNLQNLKKLLEHFGEGPSGCNYHMTELLFIISCHLNAYVPIEVNVMDYFHRLFVLLFIDFVVVYFCFQNGENTQVFCTY